HHIDILFSLSLIYAYLLSFFVGIICLITCMYADLPKMKEPKATASFVHLLDSAVDACMIGFARYRTGFTNCPHFFVAVAIAWYDYILYLLFIISIIVLHYSALLIALFDRKVVIMFIYEITKNFLRASQKSSTVRMHCSIRFAFA
ncbi:hypothetical protein ACJX0J_007300, partial [Zea mays]